MGEPSSGAVGRWRLRSVPDQLAQRYVAEGWWTDDTLGTMVAEGLADRGEVGFQVRSKVRPWQGTFADVDRAARSLAGALQARGVGPGDVVLFQIPNWVEAGITFWAAAYLGAVVVPVVHFYGAKEVTYILGATSPDVIVTADRFGHNDFVATYDALLVDRPEPRWLVTTGPDDGELPERAIRFESLLDHEPIAGPVAVDPDAPAVIGFTSGPPAIPRA